MRPSSPKELTQLERGFRGPPYCYDVAGHAVMIPEVVPTRLGSHVVEVGCLTVQCTRSEIVLSRFHEHNMKIPKPGCRVAQRETPKMFGLWRILRQHQPQQERGFRPRQKKPDTSNETKQTRKMTETLL